MNFFFTFFFLIFNIALSHSFVRTSTTFLPFAGTRLMRTCNKVQKIKEEKIRHEISTKKKNRKEKNGMNGTEWQNRKVVDNYLWNTMWKSISIFVLLFTWQLCNEIWGERKINNKKEKIKNFHSRFFFILSKASKQNNEKHAYFFSSL